MTASPEYGARRCEECKATLTDLEAPDHLCRWCRRIAERNAPRIVHLIEVYMQGYEKAQGETQWIKDVRQIIAEETA